MTLINKGMSFREAYQKAIAQIKATTFASGVQKNSRKKSIHHLSLNSICEQYPRHLLFKALEKILSK
jgi:hypothetical protein